jgi:hypothetical protein
MDEMGGACSMLGRGEIHVEKVLTEHLKKGYHLEDLRKDGRKILKFILKK